MTFDIRKTVSAAAYLAKKSGGKINVLYLMKMLYIADRFALLNWHRPITGDKFYSLKFGPIVSRTYDLVKGGVMGSDMEIWREAFTTREGNEIGVKEGADLDWLSEREIKMLDDAHALLAKLPVGHMIEALHRELPEWKDPNGSSEPIDPRDIFLVNGVGEEEANAIMTELDSQQSAKAFFASR